MRPPYDGFTWHLSQHAIAIDSQNLFSLLKAASLFAGQAGKSAEISSHLVHSKVLTSNVRRDSERADAWRDYQQVLPELGLMVSTDILPHITITPVGMLLLDGSLGISESITNQMLRYQYPNGFKWTISPRVRGSFGSRGGSYDNLVQLQIDHQILVKPTILLLRFLLQLHKDRLPPSISISECQGFLIPIARHQQWPVAYAELLHARKRGKEFPLYGVRRNVQDWFKLLQRTDIFALNSKGHLVLSSGAETRLTELDQICTYYEKPETFWIPSGPLGAARLSWFNHFGQYAVQGQWINTQPSTTYIEQNYVEGIEVDEEAGAIEITSGAGIALTKFDEAEAGKRFSDAFVHKPQFYDRAKSLSRLQEKSRLHQTVLINLARNLSAKGFDVNVSQGGQDESVDLVADHSQARSILEVKTITRKNWRQRLRLGVGQLSEYRYRMEKQDGQRPSAILVISAETNLPPWLTDFLQKDVKIGLVSFTPERFIPHTNISIERIIAA